MHSASYRHALFERHGRTATAFRALGGDLSHWEDTEADAFVGFARVPGAWVAAGEPVAPLDALAPVAQRYLDAAAREGKRASFFATEGRLTTVPSLRRQLIGEQPVWDAREWSTHLASHRSLREQIRRARAKQVTIRALTPAEMSSAGWQAPLRALIERWRATRSMSAMGFLVTVDLETHAAARRTWVAIRNGTLMGLLSLAPVPARGGWIMEHLLRDPDAPNGTAEQLVDTAMRTMAADGVPWVTLGLAPLHGNVGPWLTRIRTWSRPLFNFEGLALFKRKLRPSHWEPVYLAWPSAATPGRTWWRGVMAMRDGLRAFAGGSLVAFGARTVLRGPRPLLRMLEWLLVPWTALLALAPTAPWFPSTSVHASWVAFDGALLLALRQLHHGVARRGTAARRVSATLATGIASAITVDAVLTLWQAFAWNAPRASHAGDWLVLVIACAGPAVTAPAMWGAARRLRQLAASPPPVPGEAAGRSDAAVVTQ